MKLPILVNSEFSLVKSSHDMVESIWWRIFFGAVNFVNGEMVDGGGAVNFLEEYERKIPNSSAFNSVSLSPRYSSHSLAQFISLLRKQQIRCANRESCPVQKFAESETCFLELR